MTARVAGLALLSLAIVAAAPFVGSMPDGEVGTFILWQLRLPRVVLGALVGALLGGVGAAYQALFDNPLATPSTTGTVAGAAVGALGVIVLFPSATGVWIPAVALGAFVGAGIATIAVTAMALSTRARVEDVLIAGIALTLASSALTAGLQVQADQLATARAVRWSLGSVAQVGFDGVALLLPFVVVALGATWRQVRALEALVAGEDVAHAQGVDVRATRAWVLGAGALGVGAAVAWCGPIAFVGLVVPHLVRRVVGAGRRALLPGSMAAGAGFLVACDTLARVVWSQGELPVGVLTAAVGAPLLFAIVWRRAR